MDYIFLQGQTIEPILRTQPNLYEYWMLPIFILVLIILAYVRVGYAKRLNRLFSSLIRIQILRQVMREELVFSHRASVLLHFNFILIGATIIYCALQINNVQVNEAQGFVLYAVIAGLLASLYIGKLILNVILRKLYRDPGILREYLFEVFLINKAAGVALIPFTVGLVFVNISRARELLWIIGIGVGLFLIFRLVQGFRMTLSYRVSLVYIILYLCTLEILPILALVKVIEL